MFQDFPESPYRVPYEGAFKVKRAPTAPPKDAPGKKRCEQELDALVKQMRKLQDRLYASDDHAVLLVFQAMDAAGKDGTIRAVMSGVNPAGCQVYSFKQPSAEELDHDFLWRCALRLPERGRIGIFNRSYYEETLIVRVHPEYLGAQKLPWRPERLDDLWEQRFESIRNFELHLARQGTVIIKFWLHVGRDEQKRRFLARIDEGAKNWKFSSGDIKERGRWKDYMKAYEEALAATSRPWAPWYAIPADDKAFMRVQVAHVITETLRSLGLEYPALSQKDREQLAEMRALLEAEDA
ncbi:MAG: polyphosphate kinase 2 family protein [Planctomycetes bacterium]|nr:polyphosphate kinase 2 family protein [Planctomycetota bacterium]